MSNNEQIKAEAIETINVIFKKILNELQAQSFPTALYKHQLFNLQLYQMALIQEVNTRDITCDHPLRAAFALEKLHQSTVDEFQTNFNNFQYHSQHSGFNPTTKRIAAVVAHGLL